MSLIILFLAIPRTRLNYENILNFKLWPTHTVRETDIKSLFVHHLYKASLQESIIRHEDFRSSFVRNAQRTPTSYIWKEKYNPAATTPIYVCMSRLGYPPWILKWGGVESSGQRLISSIDKTKIIAFFSFQQKTKKIKNVRLNKKDFFLDFLNFFNFFGFFFFFFKLIFWVFYWFFLGFFQTFCTFLDFEIFGYFRFLFIFIFLFLFFKLLRVLLRVTKVTTGNQKWPKRAKTA